MNTGIETSPGMETSPSITKVGEVDISRSWENLSYLCKSIDHGKMCLALNSFENLEILLMWWFHASTPQQDWDSALIFPRLMLPEGWNEAVTERAHQVRWLHILSPEVWHDLKSKLILLKGSGFSQLCVRLQTANIFTFVTLDLMYLGTQAIW